MCDIIVEHGIKKLTNRINLSTGLSHPLDKDAAIDILSALRTSGLVFSAEEVKIIAIRNGWKSPDANELSELAEKIISGKKPRKYSKQFTWKENIVDIIRKEQSNI